MKQRSFAANLAFAATVIVVFYWGAVTQAVGYFNLPGTLLQYSGHGFGGGYHAPLILGPVQFAVWHLPNQRHVACAPAPICGCSTYGDCGGPLEAPSSIDGVVPMPSRRSAV